MICFRDMTFCSETTCGNLECYRNFTPDLSAAAEKWWRGPDAPIAISDLRGTKICPGYTLQPNKESTL